MFIHKFRSLKEIDDEISKVGFTVAKLVLQNPSNRENIILESKKKWMN